MGTPPIPSAQRVASTAYLANDRNVGRHINLTHERWFLAAGLALGVVGAVSVAGFVARDRTAQAGLEQTLNVLGLLEQRSPGARSGAELTKHRRALAGPEELFEHALGPSFPPEAVSDVTEGLGLPSPEQLLAEPDSASDFVIAPTAGSGRSGGSFPTFAAFGGGGRGRGDDFRGGGNDFGGGGGDGGSGGAGERHRHHDKRGR